MTLQAIEPEVDQLATFSLGLHAFGDDAATHGAAHVQHGANEFELGGVGVDAADEVAIDLHVVGLQLRPRAQPRRAGAKIVDRNRAAGLTQPLQGEAQAVVIVQQAFFGELDDAAVGRKGRGARHVEEMVGEIRVLVNRVGRNVDEQLPGDARRDETLESALHAQEIEFELEAGAARGFKKILRRVQPAVGRAATQRFKTADSARSRIDDGLEQGSNAPLAHELLELLSRCVQATQAQRR